MPGNIGEDSDAVAAYTQIPLSDAVRLLGMDVMPETWISLPFDRWPKDGSWNKLKDPVCPLTQNLYGHPLAGLLWDKGSQERILKTGFEKVKGWESLYVHREKKIFLSVYVDDFHMAGPKENMGPMWKELNKNLTLDPPVPFDGHVYLGCQQVEVKPPAELMKRKNALIESIQSIRTLQPDAPDAGGEVPDAGGESEMKASKTPPQKPNKKTKSQKRAEAKAVAATLNNNNGIKAYEDRMTGSAEGCVERYLELSKYKLESLKRVGTPCIDDNLMSPEDFINKGALAPVASKIVLKALYLARLARPDLLYSVNALAREVTKWTAACDKRLHRLMSYIHHTKDHVMMSYVGDRACDCKLMLFCDASFAGDLTDSKSTSGAVLCLVGPNTFAPINWMCKKQGAVSHSSTEAEVISMDAAVRLEGIPLLNLWDLVIDVLHPETGRIDKKKIHAPQQQLPMDYRLLSEVDYVPPSMPISNGKAKLLILEDNDAVIKMCAKCRSPNMRHVGRTHRVDLDWLFERIQKDPAISIKYVNTKQQLADILTKGSFTEATWKVLCELMQIQPKTSPLNTKLCAGVPGGVDNSIVAISTPRQIKSTHRQWVSAACAMPPKENLPGLNRLQKEQTAKRLATKAAAAAATYQASPSAMAAKRVSDEMSFAEAVDSTGRATAAEDAAPAPAADDVVLPGQTAASSGQTAERTVSSSLEGVIDSVTDAPLTGVLLKRGVKGIGVSRISDEKIASMKSKRMKTGNKIMLEVNSQDLDPMVKLYSARLYELDANGNDQTVTYERINKEFNQYAIASLSYRANADATINNMAFNQQLRWNEEIGTPILDNELSLYAQSAWIKTLQEGAATLASRSGRRVFSSPARRVGSPPEGPRGRHR